MFLACDARTVNEIDIKTITAKYRNILIIHKSTNKFKLSLSENNCYEL